MIVREKNEQTEEIHKKVHDLIVQTKQGAKPDTEPVKNPPPVDPTINPEFPPPPPVLVSSPEAETKSTDIPDPDALINGKSDEGFSANTSPTTIDPFSPPKPKPVAVLDLPNRTKADSILNVPPELAPEDDLLGNPDGIQPGGKKNLHMTVVEFKQVLNEEEKKVAEEEPETLMDKVMDIIKAPIEFVPLISIPNVDDEELNKWWTPLLPTSAAIACFLITNSKIYLIFKNGLSWLVRYHLLRLSFLSRSSFQYGATSSKRAHISTESGYLCHLPCSHPSSSSRLQQALLSMPSQ